MTVSSTTINGQMVTMLPDYNVIAPTNTIWNCWTSYEEFSVPTRSECKNVFTIMLKESPSPLREMRNEFIF